MLTFSLWHLAFPEDWMLKGRSVSEFWHAEFLSWYDSISLIFDSERQERSTNGQIFSMRSAVQNLILFLSSFFIIIIPFAVKMTPLLFVPIVEHWKQLRSTHGNAWLYLYRRGAEFLERGSQWVILATLLLYLYSDRVQDNISRSWDTIIKFEGKFGDLGRTKAVEDLVYYEVNIISADLSNSDLSEGDFFGRSKFWFGEKRANFSLSRLSNTNLRNTDFECAIARGANVSRSRLQEANFRRADLRNADFTDAEYGSIWTYNFTDFSFADLRGGNFSEQDLVLENFGEVYETYESLPLKAGAWLYRADIRGAKLGNRILGLDDRLRSEWSKDVAYGPATYTNWWQSNLLSAIWDKHTVLPEQADGFLKQLGIRNGPGQRKAKEFELSEHNMILFFERFAEFRVAREAQDYSAELDIANVINSYAGGKRSQSSILCDN